MADPKAETGKVSLKTAFLYNGAGFSFNLYDTVLYAWLPFVYTPPEGSGRIAFLPLAVFGAILAGGRLLDAFSDPLIGLVHRHGDRSREPVGRTHGHVLLH
jgi:Na+/melibiose symporter-like transporter